MVERATPTRSHSGKNSRRHDVQPEGVKSRQAGKSGAENGISSEIDRTLLERGSRYGSFDGHARITMNIKRAMRDSPNWARLSDDKAEALDMIAHKLGRILNGDPEYRDSWFDLAGYATLVADELEGAANES